MSVNRRALASKGAGGARSKLSPGQVRALEAGPLCDEFPGRRRSHFVSPVASDRTMDLARAGALESDEGG